MRLPFIRWQRFGRLRIIREVDGIGAGLRRKRRVLCRCDCGREKVVLLGVLRLGTLRSCGCLKLGRRGIARPAPVAGAVWLDLAEGRWTLVDVASKHLFKGKTLGWSSGYAVWRETLPDCRMRAHFVHRMVLGLGPLKQDPTLADHVDGNRLDNRRKNLRRCGPVGNVRNAKGYSGRKFKGAFPTKSGRWYAKIGVDYRQIPLGTFDTEEEAAKAYDAAARRYFGEFARTNFSL